jgi:hypothetical protein
VPANARTAQGYCTGDPKKRANPVYAAGMIGMLGLLGTTIKMSYELLSRK